jgi:ankyrin repeat protein
MRVRGWIGVLGVAAMAAGFPAVGGAAPALLFSTPLHWAAHNGQTTIARMLISNGTDADTLDTWGRTPLHVGIWNREVAELLIESGADVDAVDRFGNTPLHLAVRYRDVVELLLSHGAQVDVKNFFGATPLELCMRLGDSPYTLSIMELLIEAGAGKSAGSR